MREETEGKRLVDEEEEVRRKERCGHGTGGDFTGGRLRRRERRSEVKGMGL